MSSFNKRISEFSSENFQRFVELLHDSPSWPDVRITDELHTIKRYLADIKFEVHRIESLVDGGSTTADSVREEPGKASEGGSELVKDLATNFVDNALNLPFWVTPLFEEAMRRAQDEEATQNPVFSGVLKILDLSFNPEHVVPRLRHYIVTGKLNRLTSQLGAVENRLSELGSMMGQQHGDLSSLKEDANSVKQELVNLAIRFEEITRNLESQLGAQAESINDAIDRIDSLSDQLRTPLNILITEVGEVSRKVTTWGETVYNKLVECCVKDDVLELLEDVSHLKREVSDIKDVVSGGEPASTRNTSGAILAAIKSVQAELSIIRGYL